MTISRVRARRIATPGVALALVLAASTASADVTKEQCVKANADGQAMRLDGKLSAARAQLEACSDPSCPALVRDDCARRLDEIERAQPTIVFELKDAAGADVGSARVTIDGNPVDRPSGVALRVDPGTHLFAFTAAGYAPVTRSFVLAEGEKDRHERIVFAPASAPAGAAGPSSGEVRETAPAAQAPAGAWSTQKTLGLTAAGVGLAGIVVGSVFGILTFSAATQTKSDCVSASSCADHGAAVSEHSTASTDGAVSTAAFIAGGALLVGGAALFFTAPRSTEQSGLLLVPSAGPGGGGVWLRARF